MGNSVGCSASGERLVSAARDGDLQEAEALLEYNPRLANYSTFGVRNSPLHIAAIKGHTEIVNLLTDYGVDVNCRNYCGQTALMQSCRYGHWEVVQTLVLNNASISKADYLNGRTALHFAAVNGFARCIRLLVADHVPSVPYFWNLTTWPVQEESSSSHPLDRCSFSKLINKAADGGVTALHMAALNCHTECVQLLLDLGADASAITFRYDTTVDMIAGAGSSPLHYAACGGSILCCQILVSRGASRDLQNCNGWTPLEVAQVWGRHWLEAILAPDTTFPPYPPSRYLALPLMSIFKIARECGWRSSESQALETEPCIVCLERNCAVAAEGCRHEFCTRCALYLCSTNTGLSASDPPGSIPCPLCRSGILSFVKLASTVPNRDLLKPTATLGLCTVCSVDESASCVPSLVQNRVELKRARVSPVTSTSFRTLSCANFSGINAPCLKDDSDNEDVIVSGVPGNSEGPGINFHEVTVV
ncbi:hypothetical protein O6H91_14G061100 [Diphasiastrum complanatum]|uniref:Uncharacterized protein n=2 Tax=Diphasiastrum complanatum TaxID=34168 RepID=A0ACC2BQ30_DIPCM|nr:hypothetical protein O6H91_14G061100 [Diphasiastrum complanatum]